MVLLPVISYVNTVLRVQTRIIKISEDRFQFLLANIFPTGTNISGEGNHMLLFIFFLLIGDEMIFTAVKLEE